MPELLDDDQSRIADLANIFQAKGHAADRRACDAEEFVLLAYIAKAAMDRALGPGNGYSTALAHLCDLPLEDGGPDEPPLAPPAIGTLPGRYRRAAQILRMASHDRIV